MLIIESKICVNCKADKCCSQQRPIINLFIKAEEQLCVVGKGKFKDLESNENFGFLGEFGNRRYDYGRERDDYKKECVFVNSGVI